MESGTKRTGKAGEGMTAYGFPMVGAHTGCSNTPYNTVESFMEGIGSGADVAEVDVRALKDGTAILFHDDSPLFREWTYEELNAPEIRTRLGSIYETRDVVRLERILDIAAQNRIRLNLDLKCKEAIEPTIRLARQYGLVDRTYITGESGDLTVRHPDIRVLWNAPSPSGANERESYSLYVDQVCRKARTEGYHGLNLHYADCLPELVEQAHEQQLKVWVYTVNDRRDMEAFIAMGVDQITTKAVGELVRLRQERML